MHSLNGAGSGKNGNLDLTERFSSHLSGISPLPGLLRSLIGRLVDRWGAHLSRHYDVRRTLVVSGSPRGGTTWLGEALASLSSHILLSEPLEPSSHANILETLGIGYDHHIPPGTHVEPGSIDWTVYQYLAAVLSGQVQLTEYLGPKKLKNLPVQNLLHFQRYVVKFIRGNLLLHWLLTEFGLKGVLIIRHPCAVVASQMHFAWQDALRWRERFIPFFEQHEPSLLKVVRSISTNEEVLALDWAVTNLFPLRQPRPHPWLLVTYEELLEDSSAWASMCNYLGVSVPSQVSIAQSSSTTKLSSGKTVPEHTVDKWRRHLTDKQIDLILGICAEVGVDFYDKSLYPMNLDKYRQSMKLTEQTSPGQLAPGGTASLHFLTQRALLL